MARAPSDAPAPPSPPTPPPSFGRLGSAAAFLPVPVGSVMTKLSRQVGEGVEYAASPVGQGFKQVVWERDSLAGPGAYVLKTTTADLAAAVPLARWRSFVADGLPQRAVTDRRSPAARRLADFARGLLAAAAALHRGKWRLGLTDADNLYVIEREGNTDVFLPDLGFAYVSPIALAKPNWLATHPRDSDTWGEDRTARQLAAPNQYRGRHPLFVGGAEPAAAWDELVQRDVRLVARLLRFVLTGDVAGSEPAAAGRCPVWKVIRDAEAGRYVDTADGSAAENMLAALLAGLRAPTEVPTAGGPTPRKSAAGKVIAAIVVLALLAAVGAFAYWWFVMRPNTPPSGTGPAPTATPTEAITPAVSGTPVVSTATTPDTTPASPLDVKTLEDLWNAAKDLAAKARAAVALGKLDPKHPLVSRTRVELLVEIRDMYKRAKNGEAVPLRSRELKDLLDQLPPPAAAPETPS